jgi:hypothetical protein
MRPRAATSLFLAALAIVAAGCERVPPAVCDRTAEGNPTVRYAEGTAEGGVYMSSPWDGELLYFPGGMRYALEHKLGAMPRWIGSYLSFSRDGTKDGGAVAMATGNQVVVLGVDATAITLANDSCVDYWLLVTAGAGEQGAPP